MSLNPRDAEKLIGGYATGTLSETERNALFAEALNNQALFDALADEEALRELLADPAARRQLLRTLETRRESALERFSAWLFRPLTMGLAAGVAAAGLAVVIVPKVMDRQRAEEVAIHRADPAIEEPSSSQPVAEQDKGTPSDTPTETAPAREQTGAPPAPKRASPPPRSSPSTLADARPAEPAALPPPTAQTPAAPEPPAQADASEEIRLRTQRASEREAGPAPAGVVGGVPPAASAPAPPAAAPAQPEAARRAGQGKAETLAAAKASAVLPPFEYVLERQARDGSWSGIEPTARLNENDRVRVALQANSAGFLSVDLQMPGGTSRTLLRANAAPGSRLHVPTQGGLPAGRGDHRLVISYLPAPVASRTPMGFRQGGAVGSADNRARKAEAVARDETSSDAPGPHTVEIPLRFR